MDHFRADLRAEFVMVDEAGGCLGGEFDLVG